jgi:NitT/TauT family transport system substrate-binding protein
VRQVFNKREIVNLGTIARYENTYITWRANSGIQIMQDLKGKKIGVTLQTISAFYLGRALDLNGISIQDVRLVDIKVADAEKAIVSGDVDAVVTWEPWVTKINQRLGQEAITQSLQSSQYAYWNLVSTGAWVKQHPDTVKRLLKSLLQAENYIEQYQDKTKAIVGKRMNFDNAYMQLIWPRYQFALSLDQSLILAMEDQARWMIANKMTKEEQVPNFLNSINEDALKQIKPESVNIIR